MSLKDMERRVENIETDMKVVATKDDVKNVKKDVQNLRSLIIWLIGVLMVILLAVLGWMGIVLFSHEGSIIQMKTILEISSNFK